MLVQPLAGRLILEACPRQRHPRAGLHAVHPTICRPHQSEAANVVHEVMRVRLQSRPGLQCLKTAPGQR